MGDKLVRKLGLAVTTMRGAAAVRHVRKKRDEELEDGSPDELGEEEWSDTEPSTSNPKFGRLASFNTTSQYFAGEVRFAWWSMDDRLLPILIRIW